MVDIEMPFQDYLFWCEGDLFKYDSWYYEKVNAYWDEVVRSKK